MTQEYASAQRPGVEEVEAALAGGFTVRWSDAAVRERVLLDTFDRLLREEGLAVRWEDGQLELLEGFDDARGVAVAAFPDPVGPIAFDALPEGVLGDRVRRVVDVRALLPVARLKVTAQSLALLDELDKTVVRGVVESPVVVPARGRPVELRTRVRLLAVRGYDVELGRAAELLCSGLGLEPVEGSLFDEAVRATGARPEGVSTKVRVEMSAGERADIAAVRVLRALLEVIEANLPGTLADTDSEFLHDLRVSVRRTRAVQRELKGVFPEADLERMRGEFKWLQQATGEARDLDVYVLGFAAMRDLLPEAMRTDLEPLRVVLGRRRTVAHGAAARALRSERAREALADWAELLDGLVVADERDRPDAARPIGELAGRRIRKVYRRMVKMGEAIRAAGREAPPEDYHELRKKGKELRYLLELFGAPLHDPGVVKPMVKTLKALQDVLGHHQDREVQMAMLRELADDVAPLPGGARALMAMGILTERLEADAAATRREFAEVFEAFASKDQRRLVKDTFR